MKLYSSTFLSLVLAFLIFLGQNGQPVKIIQSDIKPDFSPLGKTALQEGATTHLFIEIFDDFSSKAGQDFMTSTLPLIKEKYGALPETDLRVFFMTSQGTDAYKAALAAKCAGDELKFWDMLSALHQSGDYSEKSLIKIAKNLKMDASALKGCVRTEKYKTAIENENFLGTTKGVTEFPTIFINDFKLTGNAPLENIEKVIQSNF